MNLILLANTGPILLMILLLIVAGVIGYLTAWFYAKSVYKPVIKDLEDEKARLNTQIQSLNNDISDLNKKVGDLEKNIAEKEKEIAELKEPKKK